MIFLNVLINLGNENIIYSIIIIYTIFIQYYNYLEQLFNTNGKILEIKY